MSLPAPNLDDRRFQQLVDDAKRLVQRNCPEWTDHNVSDPGVTLIEAFAFMVDQLLYRLNRVPDRNYVKFLELIGIKLYPPTAARVPVTFWLSAPPIEDMEIPTETQVSTRRTEALEPVIFSTVDSLIVKDVKRQFVYSEIGENEYRDQTVLLESGQAFYCFDRIPKQGDAFYIGLTEPAPGNIVTITVDCNVEGVGVNPTDPPWIWEAWNGQEWEACELDSDTTGGFNKPGDIVVHLPMNHSVHIVDGNRAGWIRCRVVPAHEFQAAYSSSPRISALIAYSIGGTAMAVNAELVTNEVIGESEGVHSQEFRLSNAPVVPTGDPFIVEVSDQDEGWTEWTQVTSFANSGPTDRHFTLDETSGLIRFGPAVTEPNSELTQHGARPPKGEVIRVPKYRTGGGRQGAVARGAIQLLRSSIPYVTRVENRRPAVGGVDGETVDQAKTRGPILLRTRDRAVTAEDFAALTIDAAPDVARVKAIPAGSDPQMPAGESGGVRVLIVPMPAEDETGQIGFEDLVPPEELQNRIRDYIEDRRVIGTRVVIEPARYIGFSVVAQVRARQKADLIRVERDCTRALYRHFNPITGGPDGQGWPFGRPVAQGEVYAVLQRVRGVELVEDCLVFQGHPITEELEKQPRPRLVLDRTQLPFGFNHQVRVLAPIGL